MDAKALLAIFRKRAVSDVYFRAGHPPLFRRDGSTVVAKTIPAMTGARIRRTAFELMSRKQADSFSALEEVDFTAQTDAGASFGVKLFKQNGEPALNISDLSGAPKHPSLEKTPTKRHWVRLTRVCNDKCSFCLDSDAQNGTSLPQDAIIADLKKGRESGLTRVVLSGGEPTIHPDFVEIVAKARALGYTHIQTVTNGRRMFYEDFLLDSVAAGLTEATFSLHGHTPELHDRQTGSPGSFLQGLVALRRALKVPGLIVSVDTVISRHNVRHLREILDFFINEGVREFDLLQVIPFGAAWENKDELFYDVDAELAHLHRALDVSKRGDVVIWTNRLKPRHLEGYEDLIQPPSKLHDEYKGRGVMFQNFLQLGIKPSCWGRCSHCFLESSCKDIETLAQSGSLRGQPTPECLKDHPDFIAEPRPEPASALSHAADMPMKDFVDFYIDNRYFVKGAACRSCRFDTSCAGAPVEHVRRYGFPKPKPEMLKSDGRS